MLHEQTLDKLYTLRLHGMAHALEEQMKQPDMAGLALRNASPCSWMLNGSGKRTGPLLLRLKNASLKHRASIENINYRHVRQLDRRQMRSLASCQWVKQHQNVLITGPTGIGKSYLCCALLEKACREGYSASYAQAHKLFRQLAVAYVDGSYDKLLSRIAKTDVLAIDDWGLVPLADSERRHLFEVIEDRHGSRSTIVTSQFPVENWHELIGSPSIADSTIDRIIQGAHRITLLGETMRDPEVAAQMQETPELTTKAREVSVSKRRQKGGGCMSDPTPLKLKNPKDWFAAGDEVRKAVTLLTDGAFKIYIYICLHAQRNTGTLEINQTELARNIHKSQGNIRKNLRELQNAGVCNVQMTQSRHVKGIIEITPEYWPYDRGSSEPPQEAEAAYIAAVKKLLSARACVRPSFSVADERLAREWFERGIPLDLVEQTILARVRPQVCLVAQRPVQISDQQPSLF